MAVSHTPQSQPTPVLAEREAAGYLGMSPAFLRKRRREGKAPAYVRLGRRILYPQADLDALIVSARIEPSRSRSRA